MEFAQDATWWFSPLQLKKFIQIYGPTKKGEPGPKFWIAEKNDSIRPQNGTITNYGNIVFQGGFG
jgi:hypothetical protein